MIPFNKPYLTGKETQVHFDALNSEHISATGIFTKKSRPFLSSSLGLRNLY